MVRKPKAPPPGNLVQPVRLAAPTGGINAVDPAVELPARDCLFAYNVISSEQGVRVRTGWREWCTGMSGVYTNEVKTTMPFHGSTLPASKLFQTTDKGIWDVSASSVAPSLVYSFASVSLASGWGVAQAVVTSAGHFLLYADETNGLHYYSESTGTWAAYTSGGGAGQISGVDPSDVVSVTVWKNRVWLTERDTAKAYYLDAGAIFGTATAFNFGQRFAHGGSLVGLFNWSTDGGSGLDTALVALGSGGDVAIYLGTDPSSATTFGLKGVWFVGAVPAGRRIASDLGGDLLIISALGVVPLSRLILGDPDKMQYATGKVGPLFSRLANETLGQRGWAMHTHPTDNALMLLIPQGNQQNTTQLALALGQRSWSQYRDLPILCAGVWGGELFFGTADGRCGRNVGHVDGVLLATPTTGDAIAWSLLTRYAGSMSQKQVQGVRPILLSTETRPAVRVAVRYDFSLEEADAPAQPEGGSGSWDYGIVTGTLAEDSLTPDSSILIELDDEDFPFPTAGGFADIAGSNPETIEFNSYTPVTSTTGTLALADPTNLDHSDGDPIALLPSTPVENTDGTWDNALWSDTQAPTVAMKGAVGAGRDFAIAVRGSAYSRTTLVGIDLLLTEGGLL